MTIKLDQILLLILSFSLIRVNAETIQFDRHVTLEVDLAGKRIPAWKHGALRILDQTESLNPTILSLDRNGKTVSTIRFILPGATWVRTSSWDSDANGMTAICGGASDKDGRFAPFIAWSTASGEQFILRPDSYVPFHVAIGPDGHIWTLGSGRTDRADGKMPRIRQAGAPTIRRFDIKGKSVGEYLPLTEFKGKITPDDGLTLFTVGSNNRAMILSTSEDVMFEVSASGQVSKYNLPGLENQSLSGPATTPSGDVYIGVTGKSQWSISKFDRNGVGLVPVLVGKVPVSRPLILLGADGDQKLVTSSGGKTVDFYAIVK